MRTFNNSFYTPNTEATLEQATQRLVELGYKNFYFKSLSRSNGASFYFTGENGEEIRVSDHRLTGERAFSTIQVDLYPAKTLPKRKVNKPVEKFVLTDEMRERARLRKQSK